MIAQIDAKPESLFQLAPTFEGSIAASWLITSWPMWLRSNRCSESKICGRNPGIAGDDSAEMVASLSAQMVVIMRSEVGEGWREKIR